MKLTFLFTDIEGSTRKWHMYPTEMAAALAKHDSLLRNELRRYSGRVVKHTGDGFMALFTNGQSLECALSMQNVIVGTDWSAVDGLKIRIGIESGEAVENNGDFFGASVSRTARLMSSGWGGQIILGSQAAVSENLPAGASLLDQGVHLLKDLLQPQQIFILSHPDIDAPHPPLSSVSAHPHNLPVQPTPFVGRTVELQEIREILLDSRTRLLTLLGYGGAGKTRTSLQTAAETVQRFRHGAWFVPLEEADSLASILSAVARSLSFGFSGDRSELEQLAEFLSDRETLLVLDNFEHLTEYAPAVSGLLAKSPGLKILVTSRQRLGIREENVYDLSGMSIPTEPDNPLERCDATELFLSSARRVLPDFSPERSDALYITGICRILDGLPLAIELAASWVRIISCSELKNELQSGLEILKSTSTDLPARQRSMLSVFLYSWNLLDGIHQKALAGLSIFEGGFSRKAASEAAGCNLQTLQLLCDRSLVVTAGGGRYTLHPLTKELAAEKQYLVPNLDQKHAVFYHNFLSELYPLLSSGNQSKALDAISDDFPNIRKGALFTHKTLNFELMESFTRSVSPMLQFRSRLTEGAELFSELLEVFEKAASEKGCPSGKRAGTAARLKERIATFLMMTGRRGDAEICLNEAVLLAETSDDPGFRTLCFAGLGNSAYLNDDLDKAQEYWSNALAIARSGNKQGSISSLLCNLAGVSKTRGDLTMARKLLHEAQEINNRTGDAFLNAAVLAAMADIARMDGDFRKAEQCFRESLSLNMNVGNTKGASFCLENIAVILKDVSPEEALTHAEKALEFALVSGSANRISRSRLLLADLLSSESRYEEALGQLDSAEDEIRNLDTNKMKGKISDLRQSILESYERHSH